MSTNTTSDDQRLILVINGPQLWTEHGGTEQEVQCPTEEWAEDLAKLTLARIDAGWTIQVAMDKAGFRPVERSAR